jgi:hypothetical protein
MPSKPVVNIAAKLRAIVQELRHERTRRFRNGDGSLTEKALHDVYWLLLHCRGQSLDVRMQRYVQLLHRRGWRPIFIGRRVAEMQAFLADLVNDSPKRLPVARAEDSES